MCRCLSSFSSASGRFRVISVPVRITGGRLTLCNSMPLRVFSSSRRCSDRVKVLRRLKRIEQHSSRPYGSFFWTFDRYTTTVKMCSISFVMSLLSLYGNVAWIRIRFYMNNWSLHWRFLVLLNIPGLMTTVPSFIVFLQIMIELLSHVSIVLIYQSYQ